MGVGPPVSGRKYTGAQMDAMRRAYPNFVMPGHVLRIEDGMFSFVPWHKASGGGSRDPNRPQENLPLRQWKAHHPLTADPIQKRTPQERIASLAARFADDLKAGKVLTPDQLQDITAQAWKRGQPVSGEAVQAVAQHFLERAEREYEASEHKKVTRTAPSD